MQLYRQRSLNTVILRSSELHLPDVISSQQTTEAEPAAQPASSSDIGFCKQNKWSTKLLCAISKKVKVAGKLLFIIV